MCFIFLNSLVYRIKFLIFNMQKGKGLEFCIGWKTFLLVTKLHFSEARYLCILRNFTAFACVNYHRVYMAVSERVPCDMSMNDSASCC